MPAKMHAFVALGETDMKILCRAYTEIWDILKVFMDKTWMLCHIKVEMRDTTFFEDLLRQT